MMTGTINDKHDGCSALSSRADARTYAPSPNEFTWDPARGEFTHRYDRDLQLFVIWSRARKHEDRITSMIAEEFRILARFEVQWSTARMENNFERLYATGVGVGSGKSEDAGTDPFILMVVEDLAPCYQYRRNVSGFLEVTSVRAARVKRAARDLAGGYTVHSSNAIGEFFRDATLMLGPELLERILSRVSESGVPSIEPLNQDLVGANGWTDVDEVAAVLRRTTEYVVLRNSENLPESLEDDPEIDVLARARLDFAAVTNAASVHDPNGSAFLTTIAGRPVVLDVRWVGDGYLDALWEDRMLERRVVPDAGLAHPRVDDHFFSLLYHAKVQKPAVKPQYVTRLGELAARLDLPADLTVSVTEDRVAGAILDGYLSGNGYSVPQPVDRDVDRNEDFTAQLSMTEVEPDLETVVRREVWLRARQSRIGSWAAESDHLRAIVRHLRRLRPTPNRKLS